MTFTRATKKIVVPAHPPPQISYWHTWTKTSHLTKTKLQANGFLFYRLTFTRVFKATVYNGSEQLGLEEKVSKARRVNGHVAAFDRLFVPRGLGSVTRLLMLGIFFFVVQQLVFLVVAHCQLKNGGRRRRWK